jgi:hypothetical protein
MSEMRQLLQKWAEIEPGRCEKSSKNIFTIQTAPDPMEAEAKNIYDPDNLSGLDLAWIQWAVQRAIVARGWRFEFRGFSSGLGFQVELRGAPARDTNPAGALLKAYLKALEAAK